MEERAGAYLASLYQNKTCLVNIDYCLRLATKLYIVGKLYVKALKQQYTQYYAPFTSKQLIYISMN
jgi:hypothetical protein